jgi:hypothetical protein
MEGSKDPAANPTLRKNLWGPSLHLHANVVEKRCLSYFLDGEDTVIISRTQADNEISLSVRVFDLGAM